MAMNLPSSDSISASFASSINGLLASVSTARSGIEKRDKIITDLRAQLAGRDKTIFDLQAKGTIQEKSMKDLQVKNENLSSYLVLLNQTLEFLVSNDVPVNSGKYKALNRSFQVDCVICNEQRLVLWKLLPISNKVITSTSSSEKPLVRVMKHFAGKGIPSFGSVTAHVDSIDVGANEANGELGKRRRESEVEVSSNNISNVAGITIDHRTVVPATTPVVPVVTSQSSGSSTVSQTVASAPVSSAQKYFISAFASVDQNPAPTALPATIVGPIVATSTSTWPNTLPVATTHASANPLPLPSALPLPLPVNRNSNVVKATMPPPNKAFNPPSQGSTKVITTLPTASVRAEVPGPIGPLSRLDTAVAVSSVMNLQSDSQQMVQWYNEKQQTAPTGTNTQATVGSATVSTTLPQPVPSVVPAQKKQKTSVQPLPLSTVRNVVSSASKTPVVPVQNGTVNSLLPTSTATSQVNIAPVVTSIGAAPVNVTNSAQKIIATGSNNLNDTSHVHSASTLTSTGNNANSSNGSTPSNVTTTENGTQNNNGNSINGPTTAIVSSSSTSANQEPLPIDSILDTIKILPSNKPAKSWHRNTDANLRPLVIKSMIMKHKDYAQNKHDPAWIASRRKGCEILEAMQYYNCLSRGEYMTQTGVHIS